MSFDFIDHTYVESNTDLMIQLPPLPCKGKLAPSLAGEGLGRGQSVLHPNENCYIARCLPIWYSLNVLKAKATSYLH